MLFCGEGSSFIASIAVSVLLSGMLLYYFNIRLRALERTAQKQNQVLAGFLGGVQGNLVHGELHAAGQPVGMSGGSCPRPSKEASAAAAAQCFGGVCQLRPTGDEGLERIPVSDDESEGSETDSAEDYTDDSDSGSDADVIDLGNERDVGVKVIDLDSEPKAARDNMQEGDALVADTIEVLKGAVEARDAAERNADKSTGDGTQDIEDIDASSDDAEPCQAEDDGDGDEHDTVIDRLKVGELRDLAVSRSLATVGEARGMKKAQLIELLEPSTEAATTE